MVVFWKPIGCYRVRPRSECSLYVADRGIGEGSERGWGLHRFLTPWPSNAFRTSAVQSLGVAPARFRGLTRRKQGVNVATRSFFFFFFLSSCNFRSFYDDFNYLGFKWNVLSNVEIWLILSTWYNCSIILIYLEFV